MSATGTQEQEQWGADLREKKRLDVDSQGDDASCHDPHRMGSEQELRAIYGEIPERSVRKVLDHLNAPYRALVAASPLVIMATNGPDGTDCSPKGDAPGFVQMLDERTLAIPDRPGNNRIDNLLNLVRDPHISLLFLVPNVGETLRVNGLAQVTTDPALLDRFVVNDRRPRTVIVVSVREAYFHCSKSMVRSRLWDPGTWGDREKLPTAGQMHAAIDARVDAEQYDHEAVQRIRQALY